MIDLYTWPTPNGHKIHIMLEETGLPYPVAEIVLQHHERMNGSGYPQGLKGKEMLIEARILAVADVVEAMASHRPYRPAKGVENALREITEQKGTRYDAGATDACIRVIKNGFDIASDRV